jgi:DNA-3-methyladenine glycosylase II
MRISPQKLQAGLAHLRRADPILGEVINRVGACRLQLQRDRFTALVRSIIWQQISGRAASSIYQRLLDTLAPRPLSPESLAQLTLPELRAAGLSPQKAGYLVDLTRKVVSGQVKLSRLARLPDEQIIQELVQVKGIGVWTAQMFLIFSLGRLDVFPHADLGVRMALRNLYRLHELPDKRTAHRIAARWRPFSTLASWYCWRSLDAAPVLVTNGKDQ